MYCERELNRCLGMKPCMEALTCLGNCTLDKPSCAYDCGWFDPGLPIIHLVQCQADHHCLPDPVPTVGTCHGTDEDVEVAINSFDLIGGDWWIVKALCGPWGEFPCNKITFDAEE